MADCEHDPESPLMPEAGARCIWMDAGILTFKICDRDFDCENCPLDRALRGEGACPGGGADAPTGGGAEPLSRLAVDTGLHYHPGHTWVRVESQGLVRVGLDPLLTSVLGFVDAIYTRPCGESLSRDAAMGEIIQVDRCFPVLSPVSGKVVQTNPDLASSPALAIADPLRRGWLVVVEPEDLKADLARCRTGKAVLSWTMRRMDWVNAAVAPALPRQHAELGATMYDGGELIGNLRDLMPRDEYRRLVLGLLGERDDWDT